MPKKSARQCNTIGCPELTYDGYCAKHKTDRHTEYKKYRTDKREQSFYSSADWIKLRNYKRMINPLCEHCLKEDKVTPVAVIDHIVELKDDWTLRLTLSNLQSLCVSHHNKKTNKVKKEKLNNN